MRGGEGETQLETDRRKINLRIDHVKEQLESARRIRRQQRQRREAVPVPVVALVGYTNAGKSTLLNLVAGIAQPDEALLKGVLVKHFMDRQLTVEPHVVNYIALHMEQSMAAAQAIVAEIDQAAMSAHRRVTRALAGEVLARHRQS